MNHLIVIYDDVVFLLGKYCCRMYHQQRKKPENVYFFTFDKSQKYCFVYNTDLLK